MKIALMVEGRTEKAFLPYLRTYLELRLANGMPRLHPVVYNGRIPKEGKLKRLVDLLLNDGTRAADHVIALTDVYTGSSPPEFRDANDAKMKMNSWVGMERRFHPHVAQYDFEAWLLPFWPTIQNMAGHNLNAPTGAPESVDHGNPPAHRIREIFRSGSRGKVYAKPRDAASILRKNNLADSISQCPELKAFINTILRLCGATEIP